MKIVVPALVVGLAQFAAAEKHAASSGHALFGSDVMFLEADEGFLRGNNLLTATAPAPIACTTAEQQIGSPSTSATLQVLVSKCLSDDQLDEVTAWLSGLTDFYLIELAPVDDACTPSQSVLLSDPTDDDRFAIFKDVGKVINVFGSSSTNASVLLSDGQPTPIGIVSFVNTYRSLQIVQEYEQTTSVPVTPVFVCGVNQVCPTSCESCILTPSILSTDTTSVLRTIECPNQLHATPVSYLNDAGVRECVCQCETGYKRGSSGACEVVDGSSSTCAWNTAAGFRIENMAKLATCSIDSITDKSVPVPVAIDNYVAKGRTNAFTSVSDLSTSPHLDLKAYRLSTRIVNVNSATAFPSVYPSTYSAVTNAQRAGAVFETDTSGGAPSTRSIAWEDYRVARKATIDAMAFSSYGKYTIELDAKDYYTSATCQGCLVIVDKNRPTATQACTTATSSDLEPTTDNIATINSKIAAYFAFADSAAVDACSPPAMRCDAVSAQIKDMFDTNYNAAAGHAIGRAQNFFSQASAKSILKAMSALTDNELTANVPVPPGQCKRCLTMQTALKEWWIDYSCGRDYAVKKCDGDSSQTCTFEQCYIASGSTISSSSASIKTNVRATSQDVLNQIDNRASYNAQTQVHLALPDCRQFAATYAVASSACKTVARVNDLFDILSPDAGILGFSASDLTKLVKWRYKVDTDPWRVWSNTAPGFVLWQAVTPVTLEAWTKCGRVYTVEFKVYLHVSASSQVCDFFSTMWYQTTFNPQTPTTNFWTYPKSNFAEVTFDFRDTTGVLPAAPDKLMIHAKEVECRLYYNRPGAAAASKAAVISRSIWTSYTTERFAVSAIRDPGSRSYAGFHVTCDFKYQVYASPILYVQTCDQDFTIQDCGNPNANGPSVLDDTTCAPNTRCNGNNKPAPYEACGGNIVTANGVNTLLQTGGDQSCCQFCTPKYTTTCSKLPELGDDGRIKFCRPTQPSGLLLATTSEGDRRDASSPIGALLVGVGAMVVVIALVVTHRRRAAAVTKIDVDPDSYYAFLG